MYKSENLEKLKKLSEEISTGEKEETAEKKEIHGCLEKICNLLDKPKINRQIIREEIRSLMLKLS